MTITREKFDEMVNHITSMTEEEIKQAFEKAYEDTKDEPMKDWEEEYPMEEE